MNVFVDAETYYSSEDDYTLKNNELSMMEYILDPRFKLFGLGYRIDNGPLIWTNEPPKLDWSKCNVIAHNVKFDGAILAWKYSVKPKRWLDTQSMARAYYGSSQPSVSLKNIGGLLGLPPKGELNTDGLKELSPEQEKELAEYCLRDVEICAGIFEKIRPELSIAQLELMDWTARTFIEPQLEVNGQKAQETKEKLEQKRNTEIAQSGVDVKVLSSNPQFAEYLVSLGVSVPKKLSPRTKKYIPALAVGDTAFLELANGPDERIRKICKGRIAAKQTMEVSRAEKLSRLSVHGMYPFDIVFSGAEQTHRFAGGNGAGGNPQNFPRASGLREAICAPAGKTLVVGDFSNIELRVLAWLADDKKLIKDILTGDPYCSFASRIYGRPITKKDKKERQFGKCSVLGLGYGMGPQKFKQTVRIQLGEDISDQKAKEIVDLYRTYYAGVPKFWSWCEKALDFMTTKVRLPFPRPDRLMIDGSNIVLPSGLAMRYPGLKKSGREWTYRGFPYNNEPQDIKIYGGKLTENLCQSLAGEICKEAIYRFIKAGYPPAGQVHDELIVVCDTKKAQEAKTVTQNIMEKSPSWWPDIKLRAEVGVGPNWLEAKS